MFPQRSSVTYQTPATHQPPPAKELAGNLDYPNLNVADMNARLEDLSPRLHDCFDSISINELQHVALATNHRDGVQWWGMLFGYSRTDHMSVDNADFKLQCEYTVNILRYADDNVLLVALGDARLQAWSTYSSVRNPNSPYCLFLVGEDAAHKAPINQLCVFKSRPQQAVSTCLNNTLNVWDLSGADLRSMYRASAAHTNKLTGLATSATSAAQLITCDRGGCARIWDLRATSPASSCLYDDKTHMLSFSCAAWSTPSELQGDNYIYLGDYDGNVHTVDIRVPRKLQQTDAYFNVGHVSQLLVNGSHLATMSNQPAGVRIVKVAGNKHEFLYSNENPHTRLTDAVWRDEKTLLTIGHGRKLATHKL
ncbi:protein valois [Drosophila grimshawi]|uniref:GH13242 n=1 Tax=Drosophila grimshawi TaxID=7222 RepID=B4JQ88_DROGR|nr:protein valois [Drosophila grimshawi]EDV99068.1 GH13242 [Drosophila grimshawi]